MQSQMQLDDLTLNAYVDGQLVAEQEREILAAMEHDAGVRERICRLRRAKDWMRTGFADAMPPAALEGNKPMRRSFRLGGGIAASLMALALLCGGGLFGYSIGERQPNDPQTLVQNADHVLLHLDKSGSENFDAVLDYAEKFLAAHAARGAEVEVVANAGGIDLMRQGGSPYAERVRALQQQYNNLHFIACANAIRNLRKQGVDVSLLRGVHGGETAVDHIVSRLQQGWRYVKVSDLPEI